MKKLLILLALAVPANAAVTASFQRIGHTDSKPTAIAIATATLSGTYTTGGFTWVPGSIAGSPGSSPLVQRNLRAADWLSPNGFLYVTTFVPATGVATTKIFSAPGVELANAAAIPDATATVILYLGL